MQHERKRAKNQIRSEQVGDVGLGTGLHGGEDVVRILPIGDDNQARLPGAITRNILISASTSDSDKEVAPTFRTIARDSALGPKPLVGFFSAKAATE